MLKEKVLLFNFESLKNNKAVQEEQLYIYVKKSF
jgi:hypothetical protein